MRLSSGCSGHSHVPADHPTPLFPKGSLLSSRHVGDMSSALAGQSGPHIQGTCQALSDHMPAGARLPWEPGSVVSTHS